MRLYMETPNITNTTLNAEGSVSIWNEIPTIIRNFMQLARARALIQYLDSAQLSCSVAVGRAKTIDVMSIARQIFEYTNQSACKVSSRAHWYCSAPATMRILIAIYFCCALVPTSALLASKPQEKWYQHRDQKNPVNAFIEVSQ